MLALLITPRLISACVFSTQKNSDERHLKLSKCFFLIIGGGLQSVIFIDHFFIYCFCRFFFLLHMHINFFASLITLKCIRQFSCSSYKVSIVKEMYNITYFLSWSYFFTFLAHTEMQSDWNRFEEMSSWTAEVRNLGTITTFQTKYKNGIVLYYEIPILIPSGFPLLRSRGAGWIPL